MSTIALNNQNVYVNNKAEKKVEKKMSVWAKIGAFIMENADALEAYACRRKNLCPRSQIGWGISKWKNKKINDSRNNFNKCPAVFFVEKSSESFFYWF